MAMYILWFYKITIPCEGTLKARECTIYRRVSEDTWFSRIRFLVGCIRPVRRCRVELVSLLNVVKGSLTRSTVNEKHNFTVRVICGREEILSAVVSCNLFTRLSQILEKM